MSDEDEKDYDGPPPGMFDDDEHGPSTEELRHFAPRTTDAANGDAVVAEHGKALKFVLEWGAWIAWDGRRWNMTGARQEVIRLALLTARSAHYATRGLVRELEEKKRIAALSGQKDEQGEKRLAHALKLLKWHEQSQNSSRLEATAKLLETRLQVRLAQLDRDPWLLNLANGTLDLRTADLRSHDPEDLITQITEVEWDPGAVAPTWEAFVRKSMGGNFNLVLYLQRLIGYSITALTTEHVLAFFYGGGQNGKSTFVQTLRTILGEYACAAPRDLLFEKKQGDGHPSELARLYQKRLAICAEIGEHTILDEAKVKDLTGGDVISARRMREDFWDLTPTHTLFISGNHKPTVRGDDLGIWRRIRLVPWTITVTKEEVDTQLPEKLKREAAGILRWAVIGCLDWAENGLQEPDEVLDATQQYRQESDVFGEFLKQHAVFGEDEKCFRVDFRARYEAWCEEDGNNPLGAKKIAQRLHEHHVKGASVRIGSLIKNGWVGVRLKTDLERQIAAVQVEKSSLPKAS